MEQQLLNFNIKIFNPFHTVIKYFCDPHNLKLETENTFVYNNPDQILHELWRVCGLGVKFEKNYERAVIISKLLGLPLVQFNNIAKNDKQDVKIYNKLLTYENESFCVKHSDNCAFITSSDSTIYDYLYNLKAFATSYVNYRSDELWWCATLMFDEIINAIKQDTFLSPYYNNRDIIMLLKGSRPAGFILRNIIGNDESNSSFDYIQKYGRSGDNDAGILINPSLGSGLFDKIQNRIKTIARSIMIAHREKFENAVLDTVGPIMLVKPDDLPDVVLNNTVYQINPVYPSITNTFPGQSDSLSVVNKLKDYTKSPILYSESTVRIDTNDGVVKFDLLRMMVSYKTKHTYTFRTDLNLNKIRAEIADLSIIKYGSCDVDTYFSYRDQHDHTRISAKLQTGF